MALDEHVLRTWVRRVAMGQANRRDFIRAMLGLGLSGPLIAEMLATHTSAGAQGTRGVQPTFAPTRRGGGGKLRLLYWQAPTILNPHFAAGTKDVAAARVVYEPLFSIDPEGDFIPILAEEIPTVENGGRARRHLDHLAPQTGGGLARRQALHRRRCDLHLGVYRRPGHGHRHPRPV